MLFKLEKKSIYCCWGENLWNWTRVIKRREFSDFMKASIFARTLLFIVIYGNSCWMAIGWKPCGSYTETQRKLCNIISVYTNFEGMSVEFPRDILVVWVEIFYAKKCLSIQVLYDSRCFFTTTYGIVLQHFLSFRLKKETVSLSLFDFLLLDESPPKSPTRL